MQNNPTLPIKQDGYIVDVPYPPFIRREISPIWLTTISQWQGFPTADLQRPYRYLELGCGMGIHLHALAAANPLGQFVGVDFNAQHIHIAKQGLAKTQIDNLQFIQQSFTDFLSTVDENSETFDFIVLHGVWSWVSRANQDIICDIIKQLLKPNGILYLSYMSYAGASDMLAVQGFIRQMSQHLLGDSRETAHQSLHYLSKLAQQNVGLFAENPQLKEKIHALLMDDSDYPAHELLNDYFYPEYSGEMIEKWQRLGLNFVASSRVIDMFEQLLLPVSAVKLLQQIPVMALKESAKDILLHQDLRQDIYIKAEKTSIHHQHDLAKIYFTIQDLNLIERIKVNQYQEFRLNGEMHQTIKDYLQHHSKIGHIVDILPVSAVILGILYQYQHYTLNLKDLYQQIKKYQFHHISLESVWQVLMLMMWAGMIHPVRPDYVDNFATYAQQTDQWLLEQQLAWRVQARTGGLNHYEFNSDK